VEYVDYNPYLIRKLNLDPEKDLIWTGRGERIIGLPYWKIIPKEKITFDFLKELIRKIRKKGIPIFGIRIKFYYSDGDQTINILVPRKWLSENWRNYPLFPSHLL